MRYVFLLCALVLIGSQVAIGDQTDFRLAVEIPPFQPRDLTSL